MNAVLEVALVVLACEIVGHILFWLLGKWNESKDKGRITFKSFLKGIIERAFITFTLLSGLPHALTFFAALKIATRIKDEDRISNEFYLLGNILSVTLAIVYAELLGKVI